MTRGGNPMKNARVRVRNSAAQLERTYGARADAKLADFSTTPQPRAPLNRGESSRETKNPTQRQDGGGET